jgi:hypothetical protein
MDRGTPSSLCFQSFLCGGRLGISHSLLSPCPFICWSQESFRPPGTLVRVFTQDTDAPFRQPGRTPLHGELQSDVSWPEGPGSWPRRAGNAPNTLLPPIAKGREAPLRGHFIVIARANLCCGGMGGGVEGSALCVGGQT